MASRAGDATNVSEIAYHQIFFAYTEGGEVTNNSCALRCA